MPYRDFGRGEVARGGKRPAFQNLSNEFERLRASERHRRPGSTGTGEGRSRGTFIASYWIMSAKNGTPVVACALALLVGSWFGGKDACAFVPPEGENTASGGSQAADDPPPDIYLSRSTYYVGEVITGFVQCPSCYPEGPVITDLEGNLMSGTVAYGDIGPQSFAFIPDEPLGVGQYVVTIGAGSTSYFDVVQGQGEVPSFEASVGAVEVGVGASLIQRIRSIPRIRPTPTSRSPASRAVETEPVTELAALRRQGARALLGLDRGRQLG